MPKFYVTTPIYYVNDKPHIGHAYATIAADALARYRRMLGDDVFFLTGTDDNAQKNVEAAAAVKEDVYDYVDRMSAVWRLTWDELGISNDDFIRTTEPRHRAAVEQFWKAVEAKGDIYKGTYKGLYCVGCEAFYTESELVDGKCPLHNRVPEILEEENYFFRLSKYRGSLLQHISDHPEFVQPESRRHEVTNYIKDHLNDISISRPNKGWGISVPVDDAHVIYVWFDALINYLTAVGYGTDQAGFERRWPASVHIVGKDIIKFHCALWPAMLLSAGLSLPEHIFAHGFFTLDGQKISKSLGNAIDPKDLVETYGLDSLRYFLLREIPFGGDGDFSIERIAARYDADLASGLGNLVSRVVTLAAGQPELQPTQALAPAFTEVWQRYHEAWQRFAPHQALDEVWRALTLCDRYLEEKKPWALKKDPTRQVELREILGTSVEALRQVAWLLVPLLPETSAKIFTALNLPNELQQPLIEAQTWRTSPTPTVSSTSALFPRLTA